MGQCGEIKHPHEDQYQAAQQGPSGVSRLERMAAGQVNQQRQRDGRTHDENLPEYKRYALLLDQGITQRQRETGGNDGADG